MPEVSLVNQNAVMKSPPEYAEMRERRREKMISVMGIEGLRVYPKEDGLIERLSAVLDSNIEFTMMGIKVRLKSVMAGRLTYLWMTCSQGDERYVCVVWPRPMFSEGVVHYATSDTFIARVKMTIMMVGEDQIDFD